MRTGVDTNLFSVLWSSSPDRFKARELLDQVRSQGVIVLCPVVYAEMLANPVMSAPKLQDFLSQTRIIVNFELTPEVWQEAGTRFGIYAERRRRSGGGEPRRLLADFLVGAHALLQADRLLTFDVKHYRRNFPELPVISEG